MAKKKQDIPPPVQIIKNFCQLLSPYSVQEINGSYDGNGDSGCLDIMIKSTRRPQRSPGASLAPGGDNTAWIRLAEFFNPILRENDPLITQEKIAEFEDAFYELLPAGWEIDDGSYGEITVNAETLEVHIEHNERITDVHTSTATY